MCRIRITLLLIVTDIMRQPNRLFTVLETSLSGVSVALGDLRDVPHRSIDYDRRNTTRLLNVRRGYKIDTAINIKFGDSVQVVA